jgi:hypothetical protein
LSTANRPVEHLISLGHRRTVVELTEHGRAAVAALRRWFAAAFADIDPAQLPQVTAALSSVAVNLRAQAEDLATQPPAEYPVTAR